jgi:hypothetical protein
MHVFPGKPCLALILSSPDRLQAGKDSVAVLLEKLPMHYRLGMCAWIRGRRQQRHQERNNNSISNLQSSGCQNGSNAIIGSMCAL